LLGGLIARFRGFRAGPPRASGRGALVIGGVVVQSLRRSAYERGSVLQMLKAGDAWFPGFGEIYFSTVYPGVVKGWHLHQRMILNYAVPHGSIKLVLYDDRAGSRTQGEVQE